jgi:uncharacterized protein
MFIGILTLELFLPGAESLKEKRMVVNSVLDRIKARFNVSAAQIDDHDLWQSATLGIAVVSNERNAANRVLNMVRDLVETETRCDVVNCVVEII